MALELIHLGGESQVRVKEVHLAQGAQHRKVDSDAVNYASTSI